MSESRSGRQKDAPIGMTIQRIVRISAASSVALVATVIGILFALVSIYLMFAAGRIGQLRDRTIATLPGWNVTLERRFAHLFLAEYERTLVVQQVGAGSVREAISMDPGGATRITICQTQTGSLVLHDRMGQIGLVQADQFPFVVHGPPINESCSRYLGAFERGSEGTYHFLAEHLPESRLGD